MNWTEHHYPSGDLYTTRQRHRPVSAEEVANSVIWALINGMDVDLVPAGVIPIQIGDPRTGDTTHYTHD